MKNLLVQKIRECTPVLQPYENKKSMYEITSKFELQILLC